MITVNPYLNFGGNCMEAFEFYRSIFGGDFSYVGRYSEMPTEGSEEMPEHVKNMIMHMSLPISKETALMGSDVYEGFGQKLEMGGNVELLINTGSKEEADALWAKLSEGATITMPLEEAFWGDYFGSLTDKFGTKWMVISPIE